MNSSFSPVALWKHQHLKKLNVIIWKGHHSLREDSASDMICTASILWKYQGNSIEWKQKSSAVRFWSEAKLSVGVLIRWNSVWKWSGNELLIFTGCHNIVKSVIYISLQSEIMRWDGENDVLSRFECRWCAGGTLPVDHNYNRGEGLLRCHCLIQKQ